MLIQEIIRRKRDGEVLAPDAIAAMVAAITDGAAGDGQVAAFAMAVLLRGMETSERVALTIAMRDSGAVLAWDAASLGGPVLDKHSTGGVGDKVSLILAPIIAACGGFVPMISGRGLGHTGGTLDKLDAIPGYCSTPAIERLRRTVAEAGCAIVGQTSDLAPADQRLYAIRDVTATVESMPLIIASILSKKLAAGLDVLVMDVKCGNGAFMSSIEDARELASGLVGVAIGAGLPTRALITDMNQALGTTAGNAVETAEALAVLTGAAGDVRLIEVTLALAAQMLVSGGLADDVHAGAGLARRALESGAAAEHFACMVTALGGPADLLQRWSDYLAKAPVVQPVLATGLGTVQSVDARELGLAVVELGGGRRNPQDAIDPAVGLTDIVGIGAEIGPDRPLALIHARDAASADRAAAQIRAAYQISDAPPPEVSPVVLETVLGAD